MGISKINPISTNASTTCAMEVWRISMSERLYKEMQGQASGAYNTPRRVEPAVRIEISPEARRIQGEQ